MQLLPKTPSRRAACLVIIGLGIAGVSLPVRGAELTPAQIVALRFPAAWNLVPPPAPVRVASADGELFSPYPMSRPAPVRTNPLADAAPSGTRLAYADPSADIAAERTGSVAPAPEKRVVKPRPKEPATLFNAAQLASIKERLNLTPDQEAYWPGVESALRGIGRMRAAAGGKGGGKADPGAIDPNSAEVQQLKSAAIPLIMRMREDQKREVRQLARVMGLEQLAAAF